MRAAVLAAAACLAAGCGPSNKLSLAAPASPAEAGGEEALIAQTAEINDMLGGCIRERSDARPSKVVSLANGTIVMAACSSSAYAYTERLFSMREGQPPELLTLPDFGPDGWFATDQVGMAELDAGTGTLTSFSKAGESDACGSEGRYQWNGQRFVLQELRWQPCGAATDAGLPFPLVWPVQTSNAIQPGDSTPEP